MSKLFSKIRSQLLCTFGGVFEAADRKLRHQLRHKIEYDIDAILKIENPEKSYWALHRAIMADKHRDALPIEIQILSLADFTSNCLTNGFLTFDGNARWAVVPAADLMTAIGETEFAKELWACIEIRRDYGKKIGRDPFGANVEYVALDEETENKINARKFDFTDYVDPAIDERLMRKTMEYVRKNRELFLKPKIS